MLIFGQKVIFDFCEIYPPMKKKQIQKQPFAQWYKIGTLGHITPNDISKKSHSVFLIIP